jgi:hypothetical protein
LATLRASAYFSMKTRCWRGNSGGWAGGGTAVLRLRRKRACHGQAE